MTNDPPKYQWEWYNNLARKVLEEQKNRSILNPSVPTGFPMLDELVGGGFEPGELIVLSAPTKQGKSTLAQTMTVNMALAGRTSLWFTMEMSWRELTKKFMAMDKNFQDTQKTLSQFAIHYPIDNYYGGGKLQMEWLRTMIKESQRIEHTEFVVIDHLHYLLPLNDYNTNTSFLIGGIVREIKKIAVELNIPILLIAHTTKLDIEQSPNINSIRDSSFIAQESDFVLILWRIREKGAGKKTYDDDSDNTILYTNKAWLSLEANRRNGKTGRIKLYHDGAKFIPCTKELEFTSFAKEKTYAKNEPSIPNF